MIQRFLSEGHEVRVTDFVLFISEDCITARSAFLVGIPLSQAELAINSHTMVLIHLHFLLFPPYLLFLFSSFYYSNHFVQTSREFLCGGKIKCEPVIRVFFPLRHTNPHLCSTQW